MSKIDFPTFLASTSKHSPIQHHLSMSKESELIKNLRKHLDAMTPKELEEAKKMLSESSDGPTVDEYLSMMKKINDRQKKFLDGIKAGTIPNYTGNYPVDSGMLFGMVFFDGTNHCIYIGEGYSVTEAVFLDNV